MRLVRRSLGEGGSMVEGASLAPVIRHDRYAPERLPVHARRSAKAGALPALLLRIAFYPRALGGDARRPGVVPKATGRNSVTSCGVPRPCIHASVCHKYRAVIAAQNAVSFQMKTHTKKRPVDRRGF
jgi:hypothetical protein